MPPKRAPAPPRQKAVIGAAKKAKADAKYAAAAAYALTADHTLVVVESPSKCKKIQEILGAQYKVVATRGHLYEIDGLRAINKKTYEPTYQILAHQQETVRHLRDEVAIAGGGVILASDGDREGEIIAYHFCLIFGLDPATTPRIIFNEITDVAIRAAVAAPKRIDMDLVHAQQARAVLDVLVGYKISPVLWRYVPKMGEMALSAGRCQTPALRLIYDNYMERCLAAQQPPEISYKIIGYFFSQNFPFEWSGVVADPPAFLRASQTHKHILRAAENIKKQSIQSAPAPFNTSALIQAASNQLSLSPKDTMRHCQSLYQSGYITYMRTDNRKFAAPFVAAAAAYITKKYGAAVLASAENLAAMTTTAAGTESHEAIRPTHIECAALPEDMEARQKSVYKLIRNQTLQSMMISAIYDTRAICISGPVVADGEYKFTVQKPRQLGWKTLTETTESINLQCAQFAFFDSVKTGAIVPYNSIETIAGLTTARHSHYTEASLVKKLEELGIGRPSTFSTLVDTIQKRGYVQKHDVEGLRVECKEWRMTAAATTIVEKITQKEFGREKNKLVIQPTGVVAIEFLLRHFSELFSYGYTAEMEQHLDIIARGESVWATLCRECDKTIKQCIAPVAAISKKKYPLDAEHYVKFSVNGPVICYSGGGGSVGAAAAEEESDDDEEEDAPPLPPQAAAPKIIYKPIKKNVTIDLIKLAEGGYTVDDLVELQNDCLGTYEGAPMYLKNGRFGAYVEWGDRRESIKQLKKPIDQITLADVDAYLKTPANEKHKNTLRAVNRDLSIRKGRFGPYLFYQTPEMEKPQFFPLGKDFRKGYMTCEPAELEDYVKSKLTAAVAAP